MNQVITAKEEIKALVISPNPAFAERICTLLCDTTLGEKSGYLYDVQHLAAVTEPMPEAHISLVDAEAADFKPSANLAKLKFELGNIPCIYLTDPLNSVHELNAVKSLTADFLLKANITGSALHNCIRWVLDNSRLKVELEQQNRRYQSLFYNAIDPSFFLSPEWEIVNINEAFTETFGLETGALEGKSFSKLFNDEKDFERVKSMLSNEERNHIDCENQFVRLDRKGRFLGHLKISVLREYTNTGGGNHKVVTGYHGSLSNISYREKLRNIKERADKIDLTYRLARTLAHEIRNPLTNINLALEQIRDEMSVEPKVQKLLEMVGRSSTRINELINQLLTASERSQLHVDECELVDLIKEVIDEAKDRVQLMDIELLTDFEASEVSYPCDTQKIKLAISNLVCNAIESIENPGGRITVGTFNEDDYLMIYVEDNGKGMSDEVKQNLFDPFFTSKDKGLGLGLTATQTIVSEHEGEIEVESAEGYGTTFTISLPLRRKRF